MRAPHPAGPVRPRDRRTPPSRGQAQSSPVPSSAGRREPAGLPSPIMTVAAAAPRAHAAGRGPADQHPGQYWRRTAKDRRGLGRAARVAPALLLGGKDQLVTKAITIADEVAAGRVLRLAGQHPSRTPGALFAIKAGPACCGRGLTL